MIAGHFATALIPKARHPEMSMAWLLAAANFPDFLWVLLGLLGIEIPHPASLLDATFANIIVEMTFSHDLVPVLVQALLFAGIVFAVTKNRALALWCAGLIVFHLACDLASGFEHHLYGPSSPSIGLNSYHGAPRAALLIEAALSSACLFYYDQKLQHRGKPLSSKRQIALMLVLVGGVIIWWPIATVPLRTWLGM